VLLFHVRGSDDWGRSCTLGYGWLPLSPNTGAVPPAFGSAAAVPLGLDCCRAAGAAAAAAAGARVRTWRLSPASWRERQACLLVGGWPELLDVGDVAGLFRSREPDVNSAATRMSMLDHNFTSLRAQRELGYHFRPIEDTVADAWQWFVSHGYARPARSRAVAVR
jgi:hypothetical protein